MNIGKGLAHWIPGVPIGKFRSFQPGLGEMKAQTLGVVLYRVKGAGKGFCGFSEDKRRSLMANGKTVIVTGGSQGIGAAIVQAFLERGYNVVATSRSISKAGYSPSPSLALVDGDIGQAETAEKVAKTAIETFGSIDHVVNNAGIFSSKPIHGLHRRRSFTLSSPPTSKGSSSSRSSRCKQMLAQGSGRQRDKHQRIAGR